MKKSPLQQVKEQFGSKEALAQKLAPLLDRNEDENDGDFLRRLRTASNRQLLRLWAVEARVKADFGSKSGLVDRVVALKFGPGGNAEYRTKVARFKKTRLLDLHDSLAKRAASA